MELDSDNTGFGLDLTAGNAGATRGVEGSHEIEVGVVLTGVTGTGIRGFLKLEISWSPDFEKRTFEDAFPALQSAVSSYRFVLEFVDGPGISLPPNYFSILLSSETLYPHILSSLVYRPFLHLKRSGR
jgi:hypothetical protein